MARPAWAKQYSKTAKRRKSGGWGKRKRGKGFKLFGIRLW